MVAREVRSTLENTSSCWQAVDTLVISPWYPASEISYNTKRRSQTECQQVVATHFIASWLVISVRGEMGQASTGLSHTPSL